jgi:Fur family ferric uptake transcriptional regulator
MTAPDHTHIERTIAEIRSNGGRVTPARRAVLGVVFDAAEHHFTAAEIMAAVEQAEPRPDRATVYRTLELLTAIGLLKPLQLDGDALVYHRTDLRHGHLVCRACGQVAEVPDRILTELAQVLERDCAFTIDAATVAISGACRVCAPGAGEHAKESQHA